MPESDQYLVRRTLTGDRNAFGDLVERYSALVHGLALEITRTPDVAEDLVQEVFCKAYEELASLQKPDRFSSWLYTIAANKAQEWLRQQRTRRRVERTVDGLAFGRISVTPEEALEKSEAHATLWEALDQLAPEYRRVLILHFWEGCSYKSIGRFLGISATAARWRALRAQGRLKQNVVGVLRQKAKGATRGRREGKEQIMAALPVVAFFRRPPPRRGWATWGWGIASCLGLAGAGSWIAMTGGVPGIRGGASMEDSADTVAGFRVQRQEMEVPETSVLWMPRRPVAGQTVRFEIAGTASWLKGQQAFLHYTRDPRYPVDHVLPLRKEGEVWSAEWRIPEDAVTFFFHVSAESQLQELDPWVFSPARKERLRRYSHVLSVHGSDRQPVQNASGLQAEMAWHSGLSHAKELALWDQEIARYPENFEAHAHRWLAVARADTSEKTRLRIEAERQALRERYPDRPEAFWWSIVYWDVKRPQLYQEMRTRFPDYSQLDDLAFLLCSDRRQESGGRVQACEELISLYPRSAYVDDAYGVLLEVLGEEDPERAVSLADSILDGDLRWEPDPVREISQRFGGTSMPMTLRGKAYISRLKELRGEVIPLSRQADVTHGVGQTRASEGQKEKRTSELLQVARELRDSGLEDHYPYYYLGEQLWVGEGDSREHGEEGSRILLAIIDVLEAGRPWAWPDHLLTFPHFQRIPAYVPTSAHGQMEQRNLNRARQEGVRYLSLLARRYLSLDQVTRAREVLEDAAEIATDLSGRDAARLFMLLGEVRQQMGDRKGAQIAYLHVLKLAPGHPAAGRLKQLLQEHPGGGGSAHAALQATRPESPDITLTDADGETVSLRGYRGRAVLMYHDGAALSDLLPRRLEILAEWQRRYAARGLVLLYICGSDRGYQRTREVDARLEAPMELLRDNGSVWSGFELNDMALLLIDRDGRLRLREEGWIEAMEAERLGRIARRIEEVMAELWPQEEAGGTRYALSRDGATSGPRPRPAVWLEAEALGLNRVRLHLNGRRDGEDGLSLKGTIDFGDQTDTTLTRFPDYVDHQYPDEGTYDIVLEAEDSGGPVATVSLQLLLQSGVRVPLPVVEYEKGYRPKPLDR